MRRLALLVIGALLAAGCTSGGRVLTTPLPTPTPTPTATVVPGIDGASAAQLKHAVRAYLQAFFGGNPATAFDALSHRCQLKVGQSWLANLSAQASTAYGPLRPQHLTVNRIHAGVGTVSYSMSVSSYDAPAQAWRYDGGWRLDTC